MVGPFKLAHVVDAGRLNLALHGRYRTGDSPACADPFREGFFVSTPRPTYRLRLCGRAVRRPSLNWAMRRAG
jgi:hypothetical protein